MKIKSVKIKTAAAALIIAMLAVGCGGREITLFETPPTPDFEHDTPVGEITSQAEVDQDFVFNMKSVSKIELYGATYMRTNSGTVVIELLSSDAEDIRDESAVTEPVAVWEMPAENFEDNTIVTLETDSATIYYSNANKGLLGKRGLIRITSPNGEPGSSVTFWTTQDNLYDEGAIRIGGYKQYNDLWFQIYGIK